MQQKTCQTTRLRGEYFHYLDLIQKTKGLIQQKKKNKMFFGNGAHQSFIIFIWSLPLSCFYSCSAQANGSFPPQGEHAVCMWEFCAALRTRDQRGPRRVWRGDTVHYIRVIPLLSSTRLSPPSPSEELSSSVFLEKHFNPANESSHTQDVTALFFILQASTHSIKQQQK